jgi:hypothetical protein
MHSDDWIVVCLFANISDIMILVDVISSFRLQQLYRNVVTSRSMIWKPFNFPKAGVPTYFACTFRPDLAPKPVPSEHT